MQYSLLLAFAFAFSSCSENPDPQNCTRNWAAMLLVLPGILLLLANMLCAICARWKTTRKSPEDAHLIQPSEEV